MIDRKPESERCHWGTSMTRGALMKKFLALAAVAAAAVASPAFASTDGALSTSSSAGKVDVTTVIPPMVRISGLTDMTINVTPEALTSPYFSRMDANSTFCVYSNIGADGGYNIKVDGDAGKTRPFTLSGTGGNLDYSVWVSDNPNNAFSGAGVNGAGYSFPGSTHSGYTTTRGGTARPVALDCAGTGKNAIVEVGVDNSTALAAQAGTYKGTLTLTVSTL